MKLNVDNIDLKLIDNIVWDGIDWNDSMDFVDAYIVSCDYDGKPLSEFDIEYLEDNFADWKYEQLMKDIF